MNYCYLRISTDKQELDRQDQIFKEKGYIEGVNSKFYRETFTGTKISRPVFTQMLEDMREGDTLVVESLSRLSRGGVIRTLDLITELIQKKKFNITIFKEGFNLVAGEKPNSTTSLLLGIFSVLGQFERDLLSERTKEGLRATREKGTVMGRPVLANSGEENFIKVLEYMIETHTGQQKACYYCDVPPASFYNWTKKMYEKYNTKDYKEILNHIKEDKEKEDIE
jgi:DNA invertase Pin-like site-specific DNA recombinase